MEKFIAIAAMIGIGGVTSQATADPNEPTNRIGVELDMGFSQSSRDDLKNADGSVTTYKDQASSSQQKVDIFFKYKSGKTTALVQADMLNAGGSSNDSGKVSLTPFDDAWVLHQIIPEFGIRAGLEWAHNNFYGLHSWFFFGPHLDLQHSNSPKLEFLGNVGGLKYGLMVFENETNSNAVKDRDNALTDNYSAQLIYNIGKSEVGVIYQNDGGYKEEGADGVETTVEDVAGYQIFAKTEIKAGLKVWMRYQQDPISSKQEGGATPSLGLSYQMNKYSVHFALHQDQTEVQKEGDNDPENQTISDLKLDYKVDPSLAYFIQYVGKSSVKVESGDENGAMSIAAVGIQAKY